MRCLTFPRLPNFSRRLTTRIMESIANILPYIMHCCPDHADLLHSVTCIKWAKKWYEGGLLVEVKMYGVALLGQDHRDENNFLKSPGSMSAY
jgi:hypothetical protein